MVDTIIHETRNYCLTHDGAAYRIYRKMPTGKSLVRAWPDARYDARTKAVDQCDRMQSALDEPRTLRGAR